MRLWRAELRAHVGTDAVLALEGEGLFVVPDPRLRLQAEPQLLLVVNTRGETLPPNALLQARYRVRPAPVNSALGPELAILEDEARRTTNPVRLSPGDPLGAVVTLSVVARPADTVAVDPHDTLPPNGLCCCPDVDPIETLSRLFAGRLRKQEIAP